MRIIFWIAALALLWMIHKDIKSQVYIPAPDQSQDDDSAWSAKI